MKLYKVKYTQESEAWVSAESESDAIEYITELTQNGGGDKMSWVRLNECGWEFEQDYGELEELTEEEMEEDFYTLLHTQDRRRLLLERRRVKIILGG